MLFDGSLLRDPPNVLTSCIEHILYREIDAQTSRTKSNQLFSSQYVRKITIRFSLPLKGIISVFVVAGLLLKARVTN